MRIDEANQTLLMRHTRTNKASYKFLMCYTRTDQANHTILVPHTRTNYANQTLLMRCTSTNEANHTHTHRRGESFTPLLLMPSYTHPWGDRRVAGDGDFVKMHTDAAARGCDVEHAASHLKGQR